MQKKLKLKWVTETIGEDYKQWSKGDIILLQAQTGCGKTYFICNVLISHLKKQGQEVLYICNRKNLKRQVKIDLLKQFNMPIPELKELDKLSKIKNVTIMSYQSMQERILDEEYGGEKFKINMYNYIICDEVHYMTSDSGFNTSCRISVDTLLKDYLPNITRIFISATMVHLKDMTIKANQEHPDSSEPIIYETGEDYSYINPIIFNNNIDIVKNLIINDSSNNKWILFVTKKQIGEDLKKELLDKGISTEFIRAGSQNAEVDSIITSCKFTTKVLICTKALDNGININDDLVKSIIIFEYDFITFKQCLGRIRVNIEDAREIDLYIPKLYKKTFLCNQKFKIQPKLDAINLFNTDYNEFLRKYEDKLGDLGEYEDIFYHKDGKFIINYMGASKVYKDNEMCLYMIDKFDARGEDAFAEEALNWLGLYDETYEENTYETIEEIPILTSEIETLEKYLDTIVGKKLYSTEQQELSNLIIKQLITVGSNIDYRTKKLKPSILESILRIQLDLQYAISKVKREDKIVESKRIAKNYIIISKIL
ncbi:DEAD/DEAH box helicase family protein [Clostridium sp.]|uniref:DEAD/DEAH box helicase family protein n=1 Tax=Clostridium sp. TaxID=1506 RepID=UPI001A50D3AD|nr:DEAD/DEAH box helicase family protein [Clostridium sp.]MBK5239785.1 DEAD/DEAH box helicase family protein [Clostridium sp.]